MLNPNDIRLYVPRPIDLQQSSNRSQEGEPAEAEEEGGAGEGKGGQASVRREVSFIPGRCSRQVSSPQVSSSLFLQHNTALVPPYRVLIDTNFINFSLQNKLELISGMMDCLYAKCESPMLLEPARGWSHDGGTRHTLRNGLRNGGVGEAGTPLPDSAEVRSFRTGDE